MSVVAFTAGLSALKMPTGECKKSLRSGCLGGFRWVQPPNHPHIIKTHVMARSGTVVVLRQRLPQTHTKTQIEDLPPLHFSMMGLLGVSHPRMRQCQRAVSVNFSESFREACQTTGLGLFFGGGGEGALNFH